MNSQNSYRKSHQMYQHEEDNLARGGMVLKANYQDLLNSQIYKNMLFLLFKSLKQRHNGIENKIPLKVALNNATMNIEGQICL